MFSLEKHRLRGKLIACFIILNGFENMDESEVFATDDYTVAKSNVAKLQRKQINLDCIHIFFSPTLLCENRILSNLQQFSVTQWVHSKTKSANTSSDLIFANADMHLLGVLCR